MSTSVVPELLSNSGRSWKDCSEIFGKQLSIRTTSSTLEYKTIRLLPRQDFPLYGEFPKLDNKVLIECEKCGMVLLPCVYPNHCNNPNHDKLIINTSGTKATTTSKNNKPSSYIPPGTSLLKKKYQQPKNKKKSGLPPPVPPPPLFTKTATPPPSNIVAPEVPLVPSGQPVSKPLSPKTSASSLTTTPTLSTSKHKKSKKSGRKSKEDEKVEKTEKSPTEVTTKVIPTSVPRRDSSKSKEFQQIFFDLGPVASESTKVSKDSLTTSTNNRTVPSFVGNKLCGVTASCQTRKIRRMSFKRPPKKNQSKVKSPVPENPYNDINVEELGIRPDDNVELSELFDIPSDQLLPLTNVPLDQYFFEMSITDQPVPYAPSSPPKEPLGELVILKASDGIYAEHSYTKLLQSRKVNKKKKK